jgi:mRNA interferase RelE/StbE
MQVEFLGKFNKDICSLKVASTKSKLLETIDSIEKAKLISEIKGLKKLKGYKDAYRVRLGDYRLGIFINKDIVQFARFVHRKDIYKLFP